MVFSSLIFICLFIPTLIISYSIASLFKSIKIKNIVLLLFSFIFIFWGSGQDIIILLAMIFINYISGLFLSRFDEKISRKTMLILTVFLSLGLLFYFKYTMFFASNINIVLGKFNLTWEVPKQVRNTLLPLGISFYTFQALSYSIDVYRKKVEPTKNLINFMLYVSLFPQLIAGPIVRYKDIYKQINDRSTDWDRIYRGMVRFVMGLAKKVLLANTVATAADSIFALDMSQINTGLAWLGILAYSLQIFLDFSAYSDMAIGLGRAFGFDLLENFNFPYIAGSIQDFWRRWHISLSTWFRDYLYIPLGGNRKGKTRTYINLLIVFFLCGLWHGAAWTFVVWGLWHGMFLIIERTKIGEFIRKLPKFIRHIYVLLEVAIGWVIFRSDSMTFALRFLKRMFIPTRSSAALKIIPSEFYQNDVIIATVLGVLSSIGLFIWIKRYCEKKKGIAIILFQIGVVLVFLLTIAKLYTSGYNPFIYFRF